MSKNSYAHLVKSATSAKEVDPDETERMEHEPPADDKEDGKKSKKAKSKKASDEGETEEKDEEKDSDEGESEEKKEDKKDKKNEDRDDKEDKKGKKASASSDEIRAAALEERLRCAKIFQSPAAAGRVNVAAQFAFHTDLSADAAIAIMENIPEQAAATGRGRLDDRMKSAAKADIGVEAPERQGNEAPAMDEKKFAALNPTQRALAIVNASRRGRGEEPLKELQAA